MIKYPLLPLLLASPALAFAVPQNGELVAWYRLDDTSWALCADSTPNAMDGVYTGGTLGAPGAAPGTGASVDFDGQSERVDIAAGGALDPLRERLSAACWMKADTLGPVQRFFGNDGSWTWGVTGTSLRFTTRAIKDYDLGVGLQTGVWYHVGVVFDGNYDVTFYLDGVQVGKVAGSSASNPPKPTWHIAYKDPNYPEYFDGHLDDIQVYDGVLTADDMRWLYENPGQELERLGDSICDGLPNSTGSASTLEATGSDEVADDDLELEVMGLPASEFGYFVMGRNPATINISAGVLCIGAPQYRFAKYPLGTGAGSVVFGVDMSSLPQGQVFLPGDSWIFQLWHTDGGTMNFSEAVGVTFK